MVEKTFRILSDSRECLEAEVIAMALLKQVTLDPDAPDARFIVIEASAERVKIPGCAR